MSTIINNPTPTTERTLVTTDSSGWAVAVIILLIVIGGGAYLWIRYHNNVQAQPAPVINVVMPHPQQTGASATL